MGIHRRASKTIRKKDDNIVNDQSKFSTKQKPHQNRSQLLVEASPEWHSIPLAEIPSFGEPIVPSIKLTQALHEYAKTVLEAETASYAQSHKQSSSAHKFYTTIMSTGTWSDRISALTLLVQESPIHNTKALDSLVSMASKKNRQQALMALSALKDMFAQGAMLPDYRKLRYFSKQPGLWASAHGVKPQWTLKEGLPGTLTKQHLLSWAFEDYLKGKYFELLRILEAWCNDEVEYAKMRSIIFVWELLKDRPEQEENLLRLLVNKLGDTDKKVASRASYLILQTQIIHPSMKPVIIDSIESEVLLRPGQSSHAKYYAVITLNQTILSSAVPEVANKLLNVYFSLFVTTLNKSKNNTQRAKKEQIVGLNGSQAAQSRKRKRTGTILNSSDIDKTEQELEERITAQVLTGVNRAFPYSQSDKGNFERHLETMFRIAHSSNFNTSIQALMLIQQISESHNVSLDRFMRTLYESLLDPRLIKSSKQTMYLNLLYRSLKSDSSVRRVKAFVKRLLQTVSLHEPSFACAVLFLALELQNRFPALRTFLDQPELSDADEEEIFNDVVSDNEGQPIDRSTDHLKPGGSSATNHFANETSTVYDGHKRDPEHSNADRSCLWEIHPWLTHYHPSVTLFAKSLLGSSKSSTSTPPKPDPQSHSLMNFLDRFVYRNARTKHISADAVPVRGTSLMQPALGASNANDTLFSRDRNAVQAQPLNREAFWSRRAEEVAPEDVFFHQYFGQISAHKNANKNFSSKPARQFSATEGDEWDDDVGAGEQEIWRALVGSREELGDDDENMDDASDPDDDDVDIADEMATDSDDDAGTFDALSTDDDKEDKFSLQSDDSEEVVEDMDSFDEGDVLEVLPEGTKSMDDFAAFGSDVDDDDENDDISVNLDSDGDAGTPLDGKSRQGHKTSASQETSRQKKRRLKALPTFASVEDYAQLIEEHDAPDGGNDWKLS